MTFRCRRSGHLMNVHDPEIVRELRGHQSYEEVKDEADEEPDETIEEAEEEVLKPKRGRPKKH